MDFVEFLERLIEYQIIFQFIDLAFGTWICFGALKWRKGLLTKVALCWGFIMGAIFGIFFTFMTYEDYPFYICIFIGVILFPILTYTVPCVNRFTLGFIVVTKLAFMCTTTMWKNGGIDIDKMFIYALIAGFIAGLIFAAWTKMAIGPFVLACAFLGASEAAPIIAKWINQLLFGITGDISYLFDPIDFLFSLLKIELTDSWTLLAMIILMILGVIKQLNSVKAQGYSYDTPVIAYETNNPDEHGKIYPEK